MFNETTFVILAATAAIGYSISFIFGIAKRQRPAIGVFIAAWVLNLLTIIGNYVVCGHPPFGNMVHVLVFLSLCFLPLHLVVRKRFDLDWTLPHFAFASLFPLIGTFFMERNLAWQRVPALQSPWFVPHVLSYMVSYATAAVAFLLMLTSLCTRNEELKLKRHNAARSVIRIALPLMTFGLWSGALWAEEAWGIYWSWDPKETWALITWCLYLASLHAYYRPDGRKRAVWTHLLAFSALVVTFLVVNLLPKFGNTLHSYAK